MNLKKRLERYLRVNLLKPGPRLIKKEFTVLRYHKGEKHWSKLCCLGTKEFRKRVAANI